MAASTASGGAALETGRPMGARVVGARLGCASAGCARALSSAALRGEQAAVRRGAGVRRQVGKMQGNKGFNMEKQNHAPRKQHQHQPHPPPSIPANGQQANSQSESRARRAGPPGPALGRR